MAKQLILLLSVNFLFKLSVLNAEEILLSVNGKKSISLTSEKFLSFTLDPEALLQDNLISNNADRNANMAKALAPAYVRIGGPRSNSYSFEKWKQSEDTITTDTAFKFYESDWVALNEWAEKSGIDLIACVSSQHTESSNKAERSSVWDPRSALDIIAFSDLMGYNVSWQLGYECQTRCDVSGEDQGKDVIRLRGILDAFPRFTKSIVVGPDVITYKTIFQQQFLQDYVLAAGPALAALTWHPNLASVTLEKDGVSLHHDNLLIEKENLLKVIGPSIYKKPFWIAESKREQCKNEFLGALVWTRRLGNAARVGAQVLMRQPEGSNLFKPTPDFWVSAIHKKLVGREVLDTKISAGNRTHVHFFCQCTKPSEQYERGSLTVFGINLTPSKISVSLKGIKIKTLHKYILLPGFDAENRMFSKNVLLNNEPLNLVNGKEIPQINPVVITNSKGTGLKLSSGSIGFWVIPGLKLKACMEEGDEVDGPLSKKFSKRLEESGGDDEVNMDDEAILNERFTVESEKSEKSKRTTIAPSIEDQLRAIHALLINSEKRRRPRDLGGFENLEKPPSIPLLRRDLDKKFGDDPLGLRRDSLFNKKRTAKDRIDEKRKNFPSRRREEAKKDSPERSIFDPKDQGSGENNFYGFSRQDPLKNFPQGDVFVSTGESSEEGKNKDYDYVDDESPQRKSSKKNKTPITQPEPDDTWNEEGTEEFSYVPNQFFEDFKLPAKRVQNNLKDFGELLEAESAQAQNPLSDLEIEDDNDQPIMEEKRDESEDKRTKDSVVKKLISYYGETKDLQDERSVDFAGARVDQRKGKLAGRLQVVKSLGNKRLKREADKQDVSSPILTTTESLKSNEETLSADVPVQEHRNAKRSPKKKDYFAITPGSSKIIGKTSSVDAADEAEPKKRHAALVEKATASKSITAEAGKKQVTEDKKAKGSHATKKRESTAEEAPKAEKITGEEAPKVEKPNSPLKKLRESTPCSEKGAKLKLELSKAREARVQARADALVALKREHEEKKARREKERLGNPLAKAPSESLTLQELQKKRAEQLEKFKEKLQSIRNKQPST